MPDLLVVTDVRLHDAPAADVRRGLVGFVSLTLNGSVRVEGLSLRRTREGRPSLSFPKRRDGRGTIHSILRPLTLEARRSIEAQVFRLLGFRLEAAP